MLDDRAVDPNQRSAAAAINEVGQVAGTWNPGSDLEDWSAWVYYRGAITNVVPFDHDWSFAHDINREGTVVGRIKNGPTAQGFVRRPDLVQILVDDGVSEGINDRGDIVGRRVYQGNLLAWVHTTNMTADIGTLGGNYAYAYAINEHRAIVGGSGYAGINGPVHAFLFACNQMTDLGTLGGDTSVALDINDRGQIVGWATKPDVFFRFPFLYEDGRMTELPRELGEQPSINNRGEIVGGSSLYSEGVLYDVRHLLPADQCWSSLVLDDINDRGDMVGHGRRCEGEPVFHAVAITEDPARFLPEP